MGSVDSGARYAHPLISEREIDQPRPLKVIYIGAGVSGICAGILFPKHVPSVELVIYEKNPDLGGTWFENRYPGCACDVPAHSYQLSFESSTDWNSFYAGAPEILEYWKKVVEKHRLRRLMRFGNKCLGAQWNAATSKWHVQFLNLEFGNTFEDVGDVLMTGVGTLNSWKWPAIKGLHDFKGKLLHSADWDTSFDATNKSVAVVGSGSSGIQIVPALLPQVKSIDHYVRGKTWVAVPFGANEVRARNNGADGNFEYSEAEKAAWKKDPASYLKYRKCLEVGMQGNYAITHHNSREQFEARQVYGQEMREKLKTKPEIVDYLLPDFPPLCKRITPGPGYLEALTSSKVDVIPTAISHVTETGIVTHDGVLHPVDAIACATGFSTSIGGHIPIIGRHGVNLQDRYASKPETYLSMCTDGFPNFFQSLGPNGFMGSGSLLTMIEQVHTYVAQVLQKMSLGNAKTVEPKRASVANFSNYCDVYFKRTVFSAECASWYKSPPPGATAKESKKARVGAPWPGSSVHAMKALAVPRFEDFEMEVHDGNEFGWFGNGWTVAEKEKDAEGLSWYLNDSKFIHDPLDNKVGTGLTISASRPDIGERLPVPESNLKFIAEVYTAEVSMSDAEQTSSISSN